MAPRTIVKIARPNLTLEWEAVKNNDHDYLGQAQNMLLASHKFACQARGSLVDFRRF